ncbi:aspartyl-phosphate phosphatase Spo0E family protein [Caldalkalibacillus salinus]
MEIKRHILHERIRVYRDFTHPKIVEISQELDTLLNRINAEKVKNTE